MTRPQWLRSLGVLPLCLLCLLVLLPTTPTTRPAMGATPGNDWKAIDKLVDEQKLDAAAKATEAILAKTKGGSDENEWAKALIKTVQLRIALHGYETSVRFLKDQPWPKGTLPRVAVELYYAHTLVIYLQSYGWEIRKRERVDAKGPVDLKAWTADQIYAEALKTYGEAWKVREELAKHPVAALGSWIDANDYPKGVRGTLRDTLAYFVVDLLADSSSWRPDELNEIYRLDLDALLEGSSPDAKLDLADGSRHPLVRLSAVLDDLEDWHDDEDHDEAALEARLERLRQLHTAFKDKDKKTKVRAAVAKALAGKEKLAWWSMGTADLASMTRETGDLAEARRLAIKARDAHKGSVGAARGAAIAAQIEAPDYQLMGMSHDAADRRSVLVTHKNLPKLYFRAWRLDLMKHIDTGKDYELLPGQDDYKRIAKTKPAASWDVELENPGDYASHRTFVTPPVKKPGLWFIVASADKGFRNEDNRIVAVNLVVSDLVIVSRQRVEGGLEITTLTGDKGAPVAGAEVRLYRFDWGKKHTVEQSAKTDSRGSVTFASRKGGYASYFVTAGKGEQVAIDTSHSYLNDPQSERSGAASFVYTDRAVYRPGQKLHWKVLAYQGTYQKADFKPMTKQDVTVIVSDANHQEVAKLTAKTNDYGTASGTFDLPTGRLLGVWSVRSSIGNSGATVRVEEYKRPTFEVSLKDPKDPLRLNKQAQLVGEARYYFGLPVTAGSVRWKVERVPVYPWWWSYYYWGEGSGSARTQTIATGTSKLDEDGTFKVSFLPEAEAKDPKAAKGLSYAYSVSCDLTDEGGETRSATRRFRLGFVSVEATVGMDVAFVKAGSKATVSVMRTSLDGVGKAGKGKWQLVALKGPAKAVLPAEMPPHSAAAMGDDEDEGGGEDEDKPSKRIAGDKKRARWEAGYTLEAQLALWKDGTEKADGSLTHEANGSAALTLPSLSPGAYRLRYETTDDFGETYETWKDFVVGDAKAPLPVPLALIAEKGSVKVGEKIRLFVHTALAGQTMVLDSWRDGRLLQRRFLSAPESGVIEVPVDENARGGLSYSLTAVMDHQYVRLTTSVSVPWDNKAVDVEFSTFRDKLRPGAKETFRVTVKSDKKPLAAAEVLGLMYDKSLDYFMPYYVASPLSVWPNRTQLPYARSNLRAANGDHVGEGDFPDVLSEVLPQPDRLKFEDGYGIGGMGGRHGYALSEGSLRAKAPMAAPSASAPMEADDSAMADAESAPRPKAENKSMDKKSQQAGVQKERRAEGEEPAAGEAAPAPLRTNFSETAFFLPHLLTGKNGEVAMEFEAPDSVTAWNVWALALTKDLRAGVAQKETKTLKDLMVRPYLPRFFREGDEAELKVVVNNAGDGELEGDVVIEITDAETGESKLADFGVKKATAGFEAKAGGSANVTFALTAPRRVGTYAFKVTAKAGKEADGELRPLPVLPGRMHLVQSRFVALRNAAKRTMKFDDLAKGGDDTLVNDRLVVTLDAQLFYGVLKALPYLVRYPYECVEQTLNRFVSTGIVASVFKDFPAVEAMAKTFAKRDTQLEQWDRTDPNHTMTLEESPWVYEAKGGAKTDDVDMVNTLDPKRVKIERDNALAKLRKAQLPDGGFPWFPGGRPSEYMTLYLMHGFAKATEFGVDVPKDMVVRGWQYLAKEFRRDYAQRMIKDDCCWEFLTFLNYVASSYPDPSWTQGSLTEKERADILAFTFGKWKKHSPYLKAYLALTLKRAGRQKDAALVFDSVMDSAKTDEDLGTYWAQEDRSWLWYNDTTESHAFALRTLMELDPKDKRTDGMVQWLFLDKKLNHWKSTRATAEVIYSLVHYLKRTGGLGVKEEATVSMGPDSKKFVFDPEVYVGKAQMVVKGAEIDPKKHAQIVVDKPTKGVMFASATWHFSTEKLPKEARGDFYEVTRSYFRRDSSGKQVSLKPLADGEAVAVGDEMEVQLSLRTKHAAEYVHLRDPRGAGFEPVANVSRWKWDLGIGWYEEIRDSGANFFFEALPVGEYTFKYRVRATMAGKFRIGPATVQSMYAPEFAAYSAGDRLSVKP